MDAPVTYEQAQSFIATLALTQPRILAMFLVLPLFNSQLIPGLVRFAIAAALGVVMVPALQGQVAARDWGAATLLATITKEAFIGFVIGYLAAIPFWIFEAVGFLVDNQRGASIASTLNPLTGNDSSPLGLMFNQAFIVFFLLTGGFSLLLGTLYDSFALWSITDWLPVLQPDSTPVMLAQLDRLVRMAVLLAAPVLVAMFLAEIGLALVSRFAPQLQVFFMAMPIKSALAMLVLMLYAASLFDYGADEVESIGRILALLRGQWGPFGAAAPTLGGAP
ncbi:EscT/YscT/HrcT family type III secretion system export apparatus protein [Melaminivora suipulveris]|uniref:EscT/YscT/HrcT family type III secretion system export apparatus protein n=1 Tax=Melaminivora suipulveris TaxID=2109913 RepID=A0A2R3QFN0_9BURK|nr:type III secretion system export apparatus subunit SctT [Melaminivora suipulveris]AVO50575.1 EscT/YscT/HrcT family type III secretion system export apparatus protein [Melaminivora suipulveris]